MDSDSVTELESVSMPVQSTVSVRTIPVGQVNINVLQQNQNESSSHISSNTGHQDQDQSYSQGQKQDQASYAETESLPDTSVTDCLFPFIDELCLETKNIARFGVKLISLKIIDKKKFDHIMEENDEYARVYKLYNEAFELNAGKKLIQALQASGNGNVVEFIKQNVDQPTLLFDIEEIQDQQSQVAPPVKIIQTQPSANRSVTNRTSNLNSSAATSAAAATLLLLESHNSLAQKLQTQQQHSHQHQQLSSTAVVPVPSPASIPSAVTSLNKNNHSNSIAIQLQMQNQNQCQQQQQLLQFAKQQHHVGTVAAEKIENAAANSFEDLLEQSLGVSIPQLLPLASLKSNNSSPSPSALVSLSGSNPITNSNSKNNPNTVPKANTPTNHHNNNTRSNNTNNNQNTTIGKKKQKRKKKAAPEEWEKNRNKLLRMQGQEYMGYKKSTDGGVEKSILIVRKKRSMGPPCNSPKCLLGKCTSCSKFTEQDREDLFQNFWLRMNWEQRKIYVSSLVDVVTVKRHKKNLDAELRRTSSLRYMLKLNGEKQRVCKSMFLSTLGIGDYSVRSWVLKHGGCPCPGMGGAQKSIVGLKSKSCKSSNKINRNSCSSNRSSSNNTCRTKKIKVEQDLPSNNNSSCTDFSSRCSGNMNLPTNSFMTVSVSGGASASVHSSAVVDGDSSSNNNCGSDNHNVNSTGDCGSSDSDNNNSNVNTGAHFLVKDYFDQLVKLPHEYLNIVTDN